jgi:hypothetical protein
MEKDEILSRIFSIAALYEEHMNITDNIDGKEKHEMQKDLDALQVVLNYFDAHYDEYKDIEW